MNFGSSCITYRGAARPSCVKSWSSAAPRTFRVRARVLIVAEFLDDLAHSDAATVSPFCIVRALFSHRMRRDEYGAFRTQAPARSPRPANRNTSSLLQPMKSALLVVTVEAERSHRTQGQLSGAFSAGMPASVSSA